jgi:BolA protein
MSRAERIAAALRGAFEAADVDVEDESAKHFGHAGARPGGETHYRVAVVSESFRGKSRVARHRLVNDALRSEFSSGLHALALELRAPGEA